MNDRAISAAPSPPVLRIQLLSPRLLCLGLLALLSACTSVPTQQFATYKETFAKAQAAGEEVLIDHAAVRTKAIEFSAARRAKRPPEPDRPTRVPPVAVAESAKATEDVAVRMRAWSVVARFNEAMTALAEGRSAAEVATAADGLLQSLNTFPITAVKELGADLVPFAGVITGLLASAEREISKQAFLDAMQKYGPVIRENFIGLLRKDIESFYAVRLGLNNAEYRRSFVEMSESLQQFRNIAAAFQLTADVKAILSSTDAALSTLPRSAEKDVIISEFKRITGEIGKGATVPDPLSLDKLQRLRDDVSDAVQRALAKNAELSPYGEVLANYGALLNSTERSLAEVERAARSPSRREPPSDELLKSVILLRQAFLKYRENQ